MSDQRPQYGELASQEEQRRLAGLPPLDQTNIDSIVVPENAASLDAGSPAAPRQADRFVTFALLAYGFVSVIMTVGTYLNLPKQMTQAMELLGIEGEFTNFAEGRTWGTIAAAILIVGFAVTVAISFRRIRAGKRSWWVPLVGAAVTTALTAVCISIPMMSDPAFIAYVTQMNTP